MQKTAATLAADARAIIKKSDAEGRELDGSERDEVESLLDQALEAKSNEDVRGQVAEFGRSMGVAAGVTAGDGSGSPMGGGWAKVADAIATKRERHIEVPTESLLRKSTPVRGKELDAERPRGRLAVRAARILGRRTGQAVPV